MEDSRAAPPNCEMPAGDAWPLHRGIVHTFPASGDADKNPYVFDVCCNKAGQLAVSACGPGHAIKVSWVLNSLDARQTLLHNSCRTSVHGGDQRLEI